MAGPARIYQPAALLRFSIRLEDSEEVGDANTFSEISPFPDRAVQLDRSLQRLTKQLAVAGADRAGGSPDGGSLARLKRQLTRVQAARERLRAGEPQAAAGTKEGGDAFTIAVRVVPLTIEVSKNGLNMADTMTASFPWLDAPFYSYVMRGVAVDVLMGTVLPAQFATADAWVLPEERGVLLFRGFVDQWETEHDGEDAMVNIQCRSYESVLMDAKIAPLAKAYRPDREETISTYVNRILGQFPQTSGKFGGDAFRARWIADPTKEPKLSRRMLNRTLQTAASRNQTLIDQGNVSPEGQPVAPDDPSSSTDPGAAEGTSGSPMMPPRNPGQEMSVWDLVVQACEIAGCLPTFDPTLPKLPARDGGAPVDPANTLLLRPAQTIFEDVNGGVSIPGGPLDGFERQFSSPQDPTRTVRSEVRFMIWGHNIRRLKTSRKLGKVRAPAVEVVSYNPDAPPGERRLSARFPNVSKKKKGSAGVQVSEEGKPLRASEIGAKGEYKIDKVITKVVRGIRDIDELQQIAVSLYHEMARQEVSVSLETDDMASYIDPTLVDQQPAHNDDPDLLRLCPGLPCRVTVARQVRALSPGEQGKLVITPLSEIFEKRSEELARFLREQNRRFKRTVNDEAQIKKATDRLARAMSSAKMLDVFYCRSVSHKLDPDGYSCSMELVNYAPVRSDPQNLSTTDKQVNEQRRLTKLVKTLQQQIDDEIKKAKERQRRQEQVRNY